MTYTRPIRFVPGKRPKFLDANGVRVPGVTSIISGGIPKPALMEWGPRVTAEYAIDHWDELTPLTPSKRLGRLKKARWEDTDQAAKRGSGIHRIAEQLNHGEEVEIPDEIAAHVESYIQFLDDWQPAIVLVEVPVVSHQHGYGGIVDLIAEIDASKLLSAGLDLDEHLVALADEGTPAVCMVDTKSSRSGIFGETALQLAGYRYADVYLDADGAEHDMPEIDATLGLHVRADGYDLIPIEAGPAQHRQLLYAQQVAAFVEGSRDLIGAPLTLPTATRRRRLETIS